MPAVNESQRRLFGLSLAVKRGKKVKAGPAARKIAKTLTEGKIKEFTGRVPSGGKEKAL